MASGARSAWDAPPEVPAALLGSATNNPSSSSSLPHAHAHAHVGATGAAPLASTSSSPPSSPPDVPPLSLHQQQRRQSMSPTPTHASERRPSLAHLVVVRPSSTVPTSPIGTAASPLFPLSPTTPSQLTSGPIFVQPLASPGYSPNPHQLSPAVPRPAFLPSPSFDAGTTAPGSFPASASAAAAGGAQATSVNRRRLSVAGRQASINTGAVVPEAIPVHPVSHSAWDPIPAALRQPAGLLNSLPDHSAPSADNAVLTGVATTTTTVHVAPAHGANASDAAAPVSSSSAGSIEGHVVSAGAGELPQTVPVAARRTSVPTVVYVNPMHGHGDAAVPMASPTATTSPFAYPATSADATAVAAAAAAAAATSMATNPLKRSRQGSFSGTVVPAPPSSRPVAFFGWNPTPDAFQPVTPTVRTVEADEDDVFGPSSNSPDHNARFGSGTSPSRTPSLPPLRNLTQPNTALAAATRRRGSLSELVFQPPQPVAKHATSVPYAWGAPGGNAGGEGAAGVVPMSTGRRMSEPSVGALPPIRGGPAARLVDVQDYQQRSYVSRGPGGTQSGAVTPRGALPNYSTMEFAGRKNVCMLHTLATSIGSFHPRFRPEEFIHTLYTPANAKQVTFYPSCRDGKVLVDNHAAQMPVKLTGPSTKVLISVVPESEYMLEGRYAIDVRWGEPPEEDNNSDHLSTGTGITGGSAAATSTASRLDLYRVFLDFRAEDVNVELSLRTGETVRVTNKSAGDWWYGCVCEMNGTPLSHYGYFPKSFLRSLILADSSGVEESEEQEEEAPKTNARSSLLPEGVSTEPTAATAALLARGSMHDMATMTAFDDADDVKKSELVAVQSPSRWFVFTLLLAVANLMMLLVALVKGGVSPENNPLLGPSYDTLQSLGARWTKDIISRGQVHLLVTPLFLPVGILRCLVDLALFSTVVMSLERICGFWRVAAIFFVSGIVGNMTGAFFISRWLVTGPSSALFGCLGALLCLHVNRAKSQGIILSFNSRSEGIVSWRRVLVMLVMTAISIFFGFLPGQDNFSQFGGFVAGYFACMAFASDMIDHRPALSHDYMVMGLLALAFLILSVSMILFVVTDVNRPCFWCMRATCIPTHNDCNAGRLGSGLTEFYSL